jgi:hyperosmotically inducible periplasmic protein
MTKPQFYMAVIGITYALAAMPLYAQDAAPHSTAPDNTEINVRDRSATEPTADQGGNAKSDREIMQNIRKSVMADKSLSTYAHNVKIISADGKVTLKGPVKSDEESKNIEGKATEVVGTDNVTNELAVKVSP